MPWRTWEDLLQTLLGTPLQVVLVVVGAVVLRWLAHRALRRMVEGTLARAEAHRSGLDAAVPRTGADQERRRQRTLTMGTLLRSTSTLVIVAVAVLTVMALVGLPLGPLLASAGVGGVALGFGAQSLVKDFLSGIFMIVEDQYGVGDVIDTGEAVGTVEEVTLRVTRLRDASGVVWFIRNGEIVRIGNKSLGWSLATVDVPVAYDEDPARVIEVLEQVVTAVHGEEPWSASLLDVPTVAGVESVTGGTMTLRIFARTLPGEQWALQRELRERAKQALDAAGVRGPRLEPGGYGPPPGA